MKLDVRIMIVKKNIFKCFVALLAIGCVLMNSSLMYASQAYGYNVVTEDYQTKTYTVGDKASSDGKICGKPAYFLTADKPVYIKGGFL